MSDESRPPIWIGHVVLESNRLAESAAFMRAIGMRPIHEGPTIAIFELRGGTHLLIFPKDAPVAGDVPFDLMVEDIDAAHARFIELGLMPSSIEDIPAIHHRCFRVREPAGHELTVYSSHVSGAPV